MNPTMSSFLSLLSITLCLALHPYLISSASPETANISLASPKTANISSASPKTANISSASPKTANISSASPETLTPLITKACAQATNKGFCKTVLSSEPDTNVKGLNDLAFIALDVAASTAAVNIEFISESLATLDASDEPADASLMQIFSDCEEQYEGAVDEIDNAVSALTLQPHDDHISTLIKDATTAIETCQKGAKGQSGKGLDLYHKNEALLNLLHNAASVFRVLGTEKDV